MQQPTPATAENPRPVAGDAMSTPLQDATARRRLISVLVRGAIGVALVVSLLVVLRPVG